jgi:hypothetical protein
MIPRTEVQSSNVRSIGYDAARRILHVEFNSKDARMPGRVYEYQNVPPEEHAALLNAPSIGAHFTRVIRGRYTGKVVSNGQP